MAAGGLAAVAALALGLAAALPNRDATLPADATPSPSPPPALLAVAPTPTPTATPEPQPTVTPSRPAQVSPLEPTATPEPTPTPAPTPLPTVTPTTTPQLSPTPAPTLSPAPTPSPTPTPTLPPATPTPAAPPADRPFRSTYVPALVVAAITSDELPGLLAQGRNGVLGAPFRPGAAVKSVYRLTGLESGQTLRREWVREGRIAAQSESVWSEGMPGVWRAALAPHLLRGGRWEVRVLVDGELAAVQPFEVDGGTLVIGEVRFTTELLSDGRPAAPGFEFPFGAERVFATFQVFNAPPGLALGVRWVHNGAVLRTVQIPWPGLSGPGAWQPVALPIDDPDGAPLDPGDWRFVLSIDGEEVLNDLFKIAAPS